jgi:hypothetical protein
VPAGRLPVSGSALGSGGEVALDGLADLRPTQHVPGYGDDQQDQEHDQALVEKRSMEGGHDGRVALTEARTHARHDDRLPPSLVTPLSSRSVAFTGSSATRWSLQPALVPF